MVKFKSFINYQAKEQKFQFVQKNKIINTNQAVELSCAKRLIQVEKKNKNQIKKINLSELKKTSENKIEMEYKNTNGKCLPHFPSVDFSEKTKKLSTN